MIKSLYPASLVADLTGKAPLASPVFTGISDFSAGGAYFGTAAAANLLDDYEEGTWSPVIYGSGGVTVYTTQVGVYTKIGNLVVASGILTGTYSTPHTGNSVIDALPFTIASDANGSSSVAMGYAKQGISITPVNSGTACYLMYCDGVLANDRAIAQFGTDISDTTFNLSFTVIYKAA